MSFLHACPVPLHMPGDLAAFAIKFDGFQMHWLRMQILIPELQSDKHVLAFRVMDQDKLGQDDTVAEYDIRLNKKSHEKSNEFLRTGEEVPMTLLLKPKSGSMERKAGHPAGEMYVLMQYRPFFNANTEVDEDDPGKAMEKVKVCASCSFLASYKRVTGDWHG
jgi:hypothetical protein